MSEGIGLDRADLAAIREDLLEGIPRRPTTPPTAIPSNRELSNSLPLPLRRALLGKGQRTFARVLGILQPLV